jgi:hypothetical protein
MTLCQQSEDAEVVPDCDGGEVLYEVLTPRLDPRDPAYAVREWPCPGCPMCVDPMVRDGDDEMAEIYMTRPDGGPFDAL